MPVMEDDDPCYPAGLPENHEPHDPKAEESVCVTCGLPIKYLANPNFPLVGYWVDLDTDLLKGANNTFGLMKTFKREEIK